MGLKPFELQQIRNWMGYGNITRLALPYIDTAPVFEVVVQNNLDEFGEKVIREKWIPQITQVETDIFEARRRYKVLEIPGDVKLNEKEHRRLLELRSWLIDRLAETIRVPRAKLKGSSRMELY